MRLEYKLCNNKKYRKNIKRRKTKMPNAHYPISLFKHYAGHELVQIKIIKHKLERQ